MPLIVNAGEPTGSPSLVVDNPPHEVRVGRWPLVSAATVAAILSIWGGLDVLNALFTGTLIVLLPVVAVVQLRWVDLTTLPRRAAYLNSMTTVLVLAAVAAGLGLWGMGAAGLGFAWPGTVSFLVWSTGLIVAGMAIIFVFVGLRRALGVEESAFLQHMLPRTKEDRRLFVFLSLSAGVGEEIVYRSYLIAVFIVVFGDPWVAAVAAALPFAAVHAYQGSLGVVRTTLLGLMLATPLVLVGSIWSAIVAHAGIDLLAGLVFADRLTDHPRSQVGGVHDGD